jgi:hypothetical protein
VPSCSANPSRALPPTALDQGSVGAVEVEVAGELLGGRVVAESPEALPPLPGQELDRHASPPPDIQMGEANPTVVGLLAREVEALGLLTVSEGGAERNTSSVACRRHHHESICV